MKKSGLKLLSVIIITAAVYTLSAAVIVCVISLSAYHFPWLFPIPWLIYNIVIGAEIRYNLQDKGLWFATGVAVLVHLAATGIVSALLWIIAHSPIVAGISAGMSLSSLSYAI